MNKKNKQGLLFKNARAIAWVIVCIVLLSLALAIIMDLNPGLYLTDRYSWYLDIGRKYLETGRPDIAIEYADKATAIDDSGVEAHYLKSRAYFSSWRYEMADNEVDKLRSIISQDNEIARYYWNKGLIQMKLGNKNKSEQYFLDGINASEEFPLNYFGLGLQHFRDGRYYLAMENFNQSMARATGLEDMTDGPSYVIMFRTGIMLSSEKIENQSVINCPNPPDDQVNPEIFYRLLES